MIARFGSVDAAPGVEPTAAVMARVLPAIDAVRRDGHGVIVVSHDAVIRPLVRSLAPERDLAIPTGSWSELRWDDGWTVISAGNVPDAAAGNVPDGRLAGDAVAGGAV